LRKIARAAIFPIALCSAMLFPPLDPVDAATVGAHRALDFTVIREGENIGTHQIHFRKNGAALEVDIKTRIAVKFAFITVFRFEHDGHEVWRGNKLVAMETKTNDDGTNHSLVVSADGYGELKIVGDSEERTVKDDIIPASLWNVAFLDDKALLNSLVGTQLAIDVVYVGEEPITVAGRTIHAKHYCMTGDFERELWYDNDSVLAKVAFKGKDGSDIQYVLR